MIHYKEYSDKNPNRQWITFVHGAGGSSAIWKKQIPFFSKAFNLLVVDLSGHGYSVSNSTQKLKDKISFESILNDVLEVLDKLNIKRSDIPAVTHVDYSARIQTVHSETNPKYYSLIKKFKEKTNCSVLINTSFNVRGEPIVNTPSDAFNCFMGTEMDKLVIGNCFLDKKKQKKNLKKDYKNQFELD